MFRFLKHLSDIKMLVKGRTLEELFGEAMVGMFAIMKGRPRLGAPLIRRKIDVVAEDLNSLLIDFLSQVLTLSEINDELYETVVFQRLSDVRLTAELKGRPWNRKNLEIKGVTYHENEIKKTKNYYQTAILFDI